MKYLKKFNESLKISVLEPNDIEELKDFCETTLAYLLDDGYNVSVSIRYRLNPEKNFLFVTLGLPEENGYGKFDWDDVKDYYIPFLQILVKRYELLPFHNSSDYIWFNTTIGYKQFRIDQVINDKVELGCKLWGINLQIVDKI